MKFAIAIALFSLLAASTSFAAPTVEFTCDIKYNYSLIDTQTVSVTNSTELIDLGEFVAHLSTKDNKRYTLDVLDRYNEVRTYADATISKLNDVLAHAVWKRTSLLEIDCKRTK